MKNKKGFVFSVKFVMAILVAIIIFIAFSSGGLSATYKAGSTLASVINILASIPAIVWVIGGAFCLLIMLKKK